MVRLSKHKAEANLLHTARHLLGAEVNLDAERLQHIGAAATARSGTIAMLSDRGTSGGSENTRRRREVECACSIAASPTGIHCPLRYRLFQVDAYGFFAHNSRQSRKLFDGLSSWPQPERREESSYLRRRSDACHNLFHDGCRLCLAKFRACRDMRNRFSNHLVALL